MKRLSFIVMACLLALGLTQCKKNEPTNNNNDDNRVSITLQLTNGGQKVHPEEENGLANVVYDNGDVVYVGSDGKYMGYLTYNGSLFVGSINAEATEGQPLQFVFMGGQTIEGLTENSSTECTFNIGDQSNGLAVISGAASNEDFSLTNLSYTAYLRNKCALVKFDLGEVSTDAAITLTGMKTEATVGFDGTVTNGETTGNITTYGTGSTRYAVVLSDQEAVTEGTVSAEGYEGTFSIPTAAYTNAFLTDATMTLTGSVGPTPVDLTTPLTLEALTDGTVVVNISGELSTGMKYSVNNGEKTLITTTTTIPVTAGDKVQFYGNGTSTQVYGDNPMVRLQGTAQTKVYGNIMSLIDETGYATLTTLPNQYYVFYCLFCQNTTLTDASDLLLPATTLANGCYFNMFGGCTSLTTAPALPATTLAESCYYEMFYGCTSLTTAPALPATTLANYCYRSMFSGCTSLTTAPALPATTLANYCYEGMFYGCTSLTTAPELPATTLANYCYRSMFYGCTSLTTAPALPAATLAGYCYYEMFQGCTGLTTAPELPATTLANYCYRSMFYGCTSLTTAPALPAETLAERCYDGMFWFCTSLTTAPVLPATTLAYGCYMNMFEGCTNLTTAPALPAATLAIYCYYEMFKGCTNLSSITCLATTGINSNNSTYNWVNGVASTGTFTKASGATWPTGSNGIPTGWTVVGPTPAAPTGAINGLFTINANGDQVHFSQGNLQYIGSAAEPYWQFAEHQWDYLGNNGQASSSQTADRDLFGWGTSGYNHGASAYQPWATSTSYSSYYAYGSSSYNLYDQTGKADWGYNAIANGGNQENFGWRTLTKDEWGYVFNSRTGAASKKGHGNVNGVNGMILLPDDWTLPEGLTFTSGNSSWANVYNAEQWAQMEANGAVFLPAAGSRNGASLNYVGIVGYYWSSSYYYSNYAFNMYFSSGFLELQYYSYRYYGYSVRLVRSAE